MGEFSKEYNFEGNFTVDDESLLVLFGFQFNIKPSPIAEN